MNSRIKFHSYLNLNFYLFILKFSGIIMCELIGRVDADPDVLPRTENFGVDYIAFSAMCPTCPPEFLKLTYNCVKVMYLVHKI